MDDEELVAAVAAGDDVALRELFCRHAPWLATRLRSLLSVADVEDVVQETFIAVWRGAQGFRPHGPVGGWIWGIARRQAALLHRRRGPASLVLPEAALEALFAEDPAEVVVSRAAIAEAVGSLGPEGSPEREAWRLMYIEDRPVAEVAELMGVPVGTVKSRLHRVRRLLQTALRGGPAAAGGPQ
jgi:RNA polymerase sigma-70 factor (ECF subfamily)